MSDISKEDIQYISKLCNIYLNEEETLRFAENFKQVLTYIDQLQKVDTTDVKPCNHVLQKHRHILREDKPGEIIPRDEFLANAPDQIGGMVRVPPVIKPS